MLEDVYKRQVSGYNVKYPIAVDVESKYILELSVQELTNVVNAFCDTIVAAGYTPIVYSDYSKFTTEMDTQQIHYCLLYTSKPFRGI